MRPATPSSQDRIPTRTARGEMAHHSGRAAEDGVLRLYERQGHVLLARRWRSAAGEIDLVLRKDGVVVFVEVKRARDIATASGRIGPRQMARILRAAEAFLGGQPAGTDSPARFDVALADSTGRIEIVENANSA